MNELSQQGFYDFVHSQPKDKTIDHYGGWEKCAVGEYVQHVLGPYKDSVGYDCRAHLWIESAEKPIPILLRDIMGNVVTARDCIPTYGVLSQFISERG